MSITPEEQAALERYRRTNPERTNMKRLVLFLMLVASTALAGDYKFKPGSTYSATVLLRANANRELEVVDGSLLIGGEVTPGPVDPVVPIITNERVKDFNDAAKAAGDPVTQKKLVLLFQGLASQINDGKYANQKSLEDTLTVALDLFLHNPTAKMKWQPTRDLLNQHWTKIAQEGGTQADYGKLLLDAAVGLNGGESGDALDLSSMLQILTLISDGTPLNLAKILKILSLILGSL